MHTAWKQNHQHYLFWMKIRKQDLILNTKREEFMSVDGLELPAGKREAKSEIRRCLNEKYGALEDRRNRCTINDLNLAGTRTLAAKTHRHFLVILHFPLTATYCRRRATNNSETKHSVLLRFSAASMDSRITPGFETTRRPPLGELSKFMTLKMRSERCLETTRSYYPVTRRHNPDESRAATLQVGGG